jgi:hypothetical protein
VNEKYRINAEGEKQMNNKSFAYPATEEAAQQFRNANSVSEYDRLKEQKNQIIKKKRKPILDALDALALALTNHGHEWTDRERELYEDAIDRLQLDPDVL